MSSCLHALLLVALLEEEHGRERRGTGDSRDPERKGNSELLHEKKKKINTPVLWEPKRLAWLGTQSALCFSSALLIHWQQPKMLSPNISSLIGRVLHRDFSCQVLRCCSEKSWSKLHWRQLLPQSSVRKCSKGCRLNYQINCCLSKASPSTDFALTLQEFKKKDLLG